MPFDRAPQSSGTLSRSRPGHRAAARDVAAWLSTAMPEATRPEAGWTPQRAGEALIEALRWARYAAGRTGPAGMVGMRLPETFLTDEEHAAMGWGLKETAGDPEDMPAMRVQLSARQVSRHEAALQWPADYLLPGHIGSARMLGLWAACKAYRRPFSKAIDGRGVSRPAAYALRDKGLSIISQGLARNRMPVDL